jgi:HAD superfamily hydrolase (TIGR01450 family)
VREVPLASLLDAYDGFLVDAYGVLVTAAAALPGARALVDEVRARDKGLVVVTNDASRTPARCAARYRELGLPIEAEQVVSSGALVVDVLAERSVDGLVLVLGPDDARQMVEAGGYALTDARAAEGSGALAAVVVADEAFVPFIDTVNATITALVRAIDRGARPVLLLPNPDVLYPRGGGALGFTAGGVAALLEHGLRARFGPDAPRFEVLGKPEPRIFATAARRLGAARPLMIGDQLDTDVVGARRAGLDVLLVGTGVGRARPDAPADHQPTYVLPSLA